MTTTRCSPCSGSGKIMGGGMIFKDCEYCDGVGRLTPCEKKSLFQHRESAHYKKAIKKIKALDKNITDEKAEEIFNDELKRIEEEK